MAETMEKIRNNVKSVKHKILVMSGKGGVGKSTVAVNLSLALADEGFRTGLMDIDLHGPNVAR
ncbi:MAG: P-loop NTPase, partial [Kosmotogaceae bacterium]